MKHDSVSARIGGRDITFKIARDDLPVFEGYTGYSAFGLFRAIATGAWRVDQIKAVLKFASMSASARKRAVAMAQLGSQPLPEKPGFIDAVFARNPPAQYATLAASVLGAALFGIDAAEATFTDEEPESAD